MASGKEHFESNKRLLIAGAVLIPIFTVNPFYGLSWIIGCTLGMFIHPDWDVNHPTYPNAVIKKKFGSIVAKVYWFVQLPYAKLIPHRSWVSHSPILSTIIRMVYIGIPLLPLAFFLPTDIIGVMLNEYTAVAIIAWMVTDLNHIRKDYT